MVWKYQDGDPREGGSVGQTGSPVGLDLYVQNLIKVDWGPVSLTSWDLD